jgi:hypothetical protein
MNRTALGRLLCVGALLTAVIISLALYFLGLRSSAFLSTTSPGGIYTVNLTGQKGRPLFLTNEVRFSVSKHGEPVVWDRHLHSADALDLSFEAGYPNYRWLGETVLQFYREDYFNAAPPDTLVIVNKAGRVIKWLRVQSVDKFLLLDLQPASEISLPNSAPRGSSKEIYVEGEFYGQESLKNQGVSIPVTQGRAGKLTYYVSITNDIRGRVHAAVRRRVVSLND